MKKFLGVVVALLLFVSTGVTNAAVMTYEITKTIGSDLYFASFTVDLLGVNVSDGTDLVVNSINFPVDGGVIYSYTSASDFLEFGGALPNFSATGNDFAFGISNATSSPTLFGFGLRIPSLGIDTGINTLDTTFRSFSGAPTPVPVPAAFIMFVTGLIGLGFVGVQKKLRFRRREPDFAPSRLRRLTGSWILGRGRLDNPMKAYS